MPDNGYAGSDSFTFTLSNATLTSSAAKVSLTVAAAAPTAKAQSINVSQNTATDITLTGSDPNVPTQTLMFAIATNPMNGVLSGFNASTGAVTYTPGNNYAGADSFTFTVTNTSGLQSSATVAIVVNKVATRTTTVGAGPFPYDGNAHKAGSGTVTGTDGFTASATLTYSANADGTGTADFIDAGTYYVTAHFAGDSVHAASAGDAVAIVISQADAVITVAPYTSATTTYDGNAHTAKGSATGVGGANLVGLDLSHTTNTNAGNYTSDYWTFHDPNNNYKDARGTVNDSITPAALTITANNATKFTGQSNPAFTVSYSGFVHGEGTGVLSGTLSFNLTATSSTTYAITPLGVTASNYTIKFVAGTLTVQSFGQATINLQAQVDGAGLQPNVQAKLDVWLQSANSAFSPMSHWGSALIQNRAGAQMLRQLVFEVGSLRGRGISDALADALIAAAQEIINAVALTT
jgi:hypothetical protein